MTSATATLAPKALGGAAMTWPATNAGAAEALADGIGVAVGATVATGGLDATAEPDATVGAVVAGVFHRHSPRARSPRDDHDPKTASQAEP